MKQVTQKPCAKALVLRIEADAELAPDSTSLERAGLTHAPGRAGARLTAGNSDRLPVLSPGPGSARGPSAQPYSAHLERRWQLPPAGTPRPARASHRPRHAAGIKDPPARQPGTTRSRAEHGAGQSTAAGSRAAPPLRSRAASPAGRAEERRPHRAGSSRAARPRRGAGTHLQRVPAERGPSERRSGAGSGREEREEGRDAAATRPPSPFKAAGAGGATPAHGPHPGQSPAQPAAVA